MFGIRNLGVLLTFSLAISVRAGGSCQDVDHMACISMAKQNTNMCSDSVLSTTVCPNYCNKCPMTCYSCNISMSDVSSCNTVTCDKNKVCMIKEINSMRTGQHKYTLGCETKAVCDGERKRSLKSRSVHIDCCVQDLCNHPSVSEPTTLGMVTIPQTSPSTTTPKAQQIDCAGSKHGFTYVSYNNTELNVPFTLSYSNVTLAECKKHCSNLTTCRGFNYYSYGYMGPECHVTSLTPYAQLHPLRPFEGCNYYIKNCF